MNTAQNFTKYVGSNIKVCDLLRTLVQQGESIDWTSECLKRRKISSYGKQKKFKWYYNHENKYLTVNYLDGRQEPIEKKKPTFFIIWIEGLDAKNGEKVKSFSEDGIKYTTKMTEAMRVKPEDIQRIVDKLKSHGVAQWAINSCFYRVHYAPKGTLFI